MLHAPWARRLPAYRLAVTLALFVLAAVVLTAVLAPQLAAQIPAAGATGLATAVTMPWWGPMVTQAAVAVTDRVAIGRRVNRRLRILSAELHELRDEFRAARIIDGNVRDGPNLREIPGTIAFPTWPDDDDDATGRKGGGPPC